MFFILFYHIFSTPDKIEHCIVWGKEFFGLLFGDRSSSLLFEEVDSVYMDCLDPTEEELQDKEKCIDFCIRLLEAILDKEIEKRVEIGTYTTSHQKPIPVNVVENVDKPGVLEGKYEQESGNYETVWSTHSCVNILITWLVKYFMEGKHVRFIIYYLYLDFTFLIR